MQDYSLLPIIKIKRKPLAVTTPDELPVVKTIYSLVYFVFDLGLSIAESPSLRLGRYGV